MHALPWSPSCNYYDQFTHLFSSRPSLMTLKLWLLLKLLPLPQLLLQQLVEKVRPRKPSKKRKKKAMTIWVSACLTKHSKVNDSSSRTMLLSVLF